MSDSWDDYADGWDDNKDVQKYAQLAFNSLVQKVNCKGLNVLDFGCGTGLLTEKLSTVCNQIVAIDPSVKMAEILSQKHLTNVKVVADYLTPESILQHVELQQSFDLIVASSVCSFLPNYPKTLSLLTSLLTPNGHWVQWDWAAKNEGDFGLTKQSIEQALIISGLNKRALNVDFSMKAKEEVMDVYIAHGIKPS